MSRETTVGASLHPKKWQYKCTSTHAMQKSKQGPGEEKLKLKINPESVKTDQVWFESVQTQLDLEVFVSRLSVREASISVSSLCLRYHESLIA